VLVTRGNDDEKYRESESLRDIVKLNNKRSMLGSAYIIVILFGCFLFYTWELKSLPIVVPAFVFTACVLSVILTIPLQRAMVNTYCPRCSDRFYGRFRVYFNWINPRRCQGCGLGANSLAEFQPKFERGHSDKW
jgi:hypothetical protein